MVLTISCSPVSKPARPVRRQHGRAWKPAAIGTENKMRFMVIVHATRDTEAGVMPGEELLEAMGKYNAELVKAGVMLDGAGLQPSSKGARVHFSGDRTRVVDGPFTETKELIAGYSVLQCNSREEAIEWVRRMPNPTGEEGIVEIRQLYELDDFGPSEAIETHFRGQDHAAAR